MATWDTGGSTWGKNPRPPKAPGAPLPTYQGPGNVLIGSSSDNPYDAMLTDVYDQAMKSAGSDPYAGAIKSATDAESYAAGQVGKDYTAELNQMSQAEIDKQQTAQANQFGALGMRELSLASDVQGDWADTRTEASTKAAIDAQAMQQAAMAAQQQALATLTATISAASGDELDALQVAISAANAGSSLVDTSGNTSSANRGVY